MHRNEKGFTLMELMVVIVIVAILAAVAVPLYINYVKDAQRTDAKAAIGAIITAEQSYYLKSPTFTNPVQTKYSTSMADLVTKGFLDAGFQADVERRWTITISSADPKVDFKITAASKPDGAVVVTYDYDQTSGGQWDKPASP